MEREQVQVLPHQDGLSLAGCKPWGEGCYLMKVKSTALSCVSYKLYLDSSSILALNYSVMLVSRYSNSAAVHLSWLSVITIALTMPVKCKFTQWLTLAAALQNNIQKALIKWEEIYLHDLNSTCQFICQSLPSRAYMSNANWIKVCCHWLPPWHADKQSRRSGQPQSGQPVLPEINHWARCIATSLVQ